MHPEVFASEMSMYKTTKGIGIWVAQGEDHPEDKEEAGKAARKDC